MFFFFFDELYYKPVVQSAFRNICLDKMLSDGYIDMSYYIHGKTTKDEIRHRLLSKHSKYTVLFDSKTPKPDDACALWDQLFGNENHNAAETLTNAESEAIVSWVYRIVGNLKEREKFTEQIFKNIKDLHSIKNKIAYKDGVFYNSETVEPAFISSIKDLQEILNQADAFDFTHKMFFRGHTKANYILEPSVFRTSALKKHESEMYQELMTRCPDDFKDCSTHLEKLVKMQHYGLPTRLLDITHNPLVALYFACEGMKKERGELVLIEAMNPADIKYPNSDTVSLLASLPLFPENEQNKFARAAEDDELSEREFQNAIARLVHEIRSEKPAFEAKVQRQDLLRNYIVLASQSNRRIVKQDGAFILYGLPNPLELNRFRYRKNGKMLIVFVNDKDKILRELELCSIHRASLFPDIDQVAQFIKEKHSK